MPLSISPPEELPFFSQVPLSTVPDTRFSEMRVMWGHQSQRMY